MSRKSRLALGLVAGTAAVVAVVAVVAGARASGAAGPKGPARATDPAAAVAHRSTQDPDQVRRYWTPERIRRADENMRRRSGPQD